MPNYCATLGAERLAMKPMGIAEEGGWTERTKRLVAGSQPILPHGHCAAMGPCKALGTLLVGRWGLGKTCLEKMERGRNMFTSISLLAEESLLFLRLCLPFLRCLLLACKAKPSLLGTKLVLHKVGAKGGYAIDVHWGRRNLLVFKMKSMRFLKKMILCPEY